MSTIASIAGPKIGSVLARFFHLEHRLGRIDPKLARVFVPWVMSHPSHIPAFLRLAKGHAKSKRVRSQHRTEGLRVPPFLVLSVTSKCNLRCSGCFAGAVGTTAGKQKGLTLHDWQALVNDAASLGVIGFIIAGGEPFLLPELVTLFRSRPDCLFIVFTNGTVLRRSDLGVLRRCRNTVVVVSLEGDHALTDFRRGPGVFESAMNNLCTFREAGILTGISVTVGAKNVEYWSQPQNIDAILGKSGPLAFFIEQIPTNGCEGGALLTAEQRSHFRRVIVEYRDRTTKGAYIIHSPADEESLGGCVSAGRGFAHVGPAGDVTACPVSALATHNVRTSSLREALASPLFRMIRDNGHLLETQNHPCGLFAHAEELEAMAKDLGAYRSGAFASNSKKARLQLSNFGLGS